MANLPSKALLDGARTVEVTYTEEKGSDVNIASHLLVDGFDGLYEAAVIISNDSDLLTPIRLVRERLQLPVGVLNPHRNTSRALQGTATFYKPIRAGALRASQFADALSDGHGAFTKPDSW